MIQNLPGWGHWGDDRHVAVVCNTCNCVYVERQWSEYAGKGGKGGYVGGIPDECSSCKREREETARKALPINQKLVEAVKRYALDNYESDGWDYIVETYSDKDLWEEIAGANTA